MGKVVSFYSFKGGTGRSTGLANIGYELAKDGADVGCLDFDVSAPGLHWIFKPGPNAIANTQTVHDYLDLNPSSAEGLDDYVIDLSQTSRDADIKGNLLLMPGRIEPRVAAESLTQEKYNVIRNLISDFEATYDLDYVLIDSRSGISNQAMPIFRQANYFLIFTKWTYQHKLGTRKLIEWIMDTNPELGEMLCIPSNVPSPSADEDIEEWVQNDLHFRTNECCILHESELLKETEQVLTKDDRDADIVEEYQAISEWLVEQ